jgi:5-oxoprolinase (ATP-hydrolysing)
MREFGFTIPSRAVLIDDIRVRASATNVPRPRAAAGTTGNGEVPTASTPVGTSKVDFEQGSFDTPLYSLDGVVPGKPIVGPAIIIDKNSTVVLEPDTTGVLNEFGDLDVVIGDGVPRSITTQLDPIHLSIFGHRFMSIARCSASWVCILVNSS